ncbi:site-specific recombinase [Cognataquiflexum rubidum]|uniref:site-specific recombinase n=1 Tax=Cognataquiflexum rubidum TaxID=2922273 RepID=UPI001F13A37F|nr:site-specific recombinase [Cognataquiflexum rubidum]MCH6234459.1 site-specific recombinase [Cognataquiflexum rubidum]
MYFSDTLEKIKNQHQDESHDLLLEIVSKIRPPKSNLLQARENLSAFIIRLKENPDAIILLRSYLKGLFDQMKSVQIFTESGILTNRGFFSEAFDRINSFFLPQVYNEKDVMAIFVAVFHKNWDYLWVNHIPTQDWAALFELLGWVEIENLPQDDSVVVQTLNSILVLSQRIGALGLEPEILSKLPELEYFDSPFIVQNKSVYDYIDQYQKDPDFDKTDQNLDYKHLMVMLSQCEEYIQLIRKNKRKFGTDLHFSYQLLRLSQNIDRLKSLLKLVSKSADQAYFEGESDLFKILVKAVNRKNSIKDHIEDNVNLLAFQITEHAGKTGEHYITNTSKEWWKMWFSSMGGGLIVGFLTIIKVMIYYLRLPLFGESFLYSMNYSLGFIGIHLTHSVLATKQPAMTASKLAAALDESDKPKSVSLNNLADLIVKISRSQFIAFVGNVTIAFPVAFLIAYVYHYFTGTHVADSEKAFHLIHGINPISSLALLHAGITGVFLFLSGLISGYYDNKNIYNRIPQRIKNNPGLTRILGPKVSLKIGTYIENNLGSLAGNFFLGIFLGTMGTIGIILGLPLDIQHITFASGNFGLAFVSVGDQLSTDQILITVAGIIGIGLMNFLVSFSLAIFVVMKSRKITYSHSSKLFKILFLRFIKRPHHFFFPSKPVDIKADGVEEKTAEKENPLSTNNKVPEENKVRPVKK